MVRTRTGNEVVHQASSYGRASREFSREQRQLSKRKAEQSSMTPRARTTRAQAKQDECLASPPSFSISPSIPATPVTPKTLRPLHGRRKPRCSDFGFSRHYTFQGQGFFFCHPCDLWDALPPDKHKTVSGDSRTYCCTAGHESFSHPTAHQSDYGLRLFAGRKVALMDMETDDDDVTIDSDSDDGTEDDNAATNTIGDGCIDTADGIVGVENPVLLSPQVMNHNATPAVTPALSPSKQIHIAQVISEYEREVASLKHTVSLLQRRNNQLTRQNRVLRRSNQNQRQQPNQSRKDHCKSQIASALNGLLAGHGHWTRVSVAKFIWDHLDGTLQPHFLKLARKHFRAHVFTPFNIIRESMIAKLSKEIAHGDVKEGAYFLLMQTLPCVLHMENRNGIKILTMVLIEGLSHAKKKFLYPEINAEGTRVSHFVSEGWEAMNSLIKTFFFRRTSHGGGVRGNSKKSRLIPIARWVQRRLMFLCHISEEEIRHYAKENPMPRNYRTQAVLQEYDVYE